VLFSLPLRSSKEVLTIRLKQKGRGKNRCCAARGGGFVKSQIEERKPRDYGPGGKQHDNRPNKMTVCKKTVRTTRAEGRRKEGDPRRQKYSERGKENKSVFNAK